MRIWVKVIFSFLVLATFSACTKKEPEPLLTPEQRIASELLERGRRSYQVNCLACHNPNPKIDGAIGPAVAGASLELLRTKILEGAYPAGYTPKRKTNTMVALPHLKDDLEALHSYLNSSL